MKKRFYIATLLFAVLLAGCAKVELVPATEKAVTFKVGSYAPQTKAVSIIAQDGIEEFNSKGYMHAEGVSGFQPFFGTDGETITYAAGDPAVWAPSHTYYWPKSANSYVNFISWVGGSPAIDCSETTGATFAWTDEVVTKTDKLLWADMAWRYNANEQTYQLDDVVEGVPTLFHHALAQIRVMARATTLSDTGVSWKVKFSYIQVRNVNNKGTLSMTNTDPGTKGTQEWDYTGWTNLSGESYELNKLYLTPKQLGTTAEEVLEWCNVIPQSVEGKELYLRFLIETNYTGKTVEEEVILEHVSLEDATVTDWNMNTKITYTIAINPDTQKITIIPTETNWTEENEYPINIE